MTFASWTADISKFIQACSIQNCVRINSMFVSTAAVLMTSCQEVLPCEAYKKWFFNKEVVEVVTDKGPEGNYFVITGFDPISHKKVVSDDLDSFYIWVKARMDVGDTLVKTKGNAAYLIKKKKINIWIEICCENGSDVFKTDTLRKNNK